MRLLWCHGREICSIAHRTIRQQSSKSGSRKANGTSLRNLQFSGNFSGTLDLQNLSLPFNCTPAGKLTIELGSGQVAWDFLEQLKAAFPPASYPPDDVVEEVPALPAAAASKPTPAPSPSVVVTTPAPAAPAAPATVTPIVTPTPATPEPKKRGRKPGPKPAIAPARPEGARRGRKPRIQPA